MTKWRTKEAREFVAMAQDMGFDAELNAVGHLRLTHRLSGRSLTAPSKFGNKRQWQNSEARLRRFCESIDAASAPNLLPHKGIKLR